MSLSKPLPPPLIRHQLAFGAACGLTDIGTVRQANEDNFLIDPDHAIVAVADGMGGHDDGAVAAQLALNALRASLHKAMPTTAPAPQRQQEHTDAIVAVHMAVDHANTVVYDANLHAGHEEGAGMGTTLTGFWQRRPGSPLVVFHVGDSRLYRLRGGELSLLTRDQTMYQQALDYGIASDATPRNVLLQAIGPVATVMPDVKMAVPKPGDLYLLCSDGLHDTVPDAALAQALAGTGAQSLERCCEALIALAKLHGSRDNITAVLALVQG